MLDKIGTEFVATYFTPGRVMPIGEIVEPWDNQDRTIQVIGYADKTVMGSQWYRFRVIPIPNEPQRPDSGRIRRTE